MAKRQVKNATPKSVPDKVDNSFINAMGGLTAAGAFGGSQVSQTDTLFKNTRNYLVSNLPYLLSEMYAEFGVVETVIDIPVEDALRGGFEVSSSQLDEEDVGQLIQVVEENDIEEVKYSEKWARLYGGGGLLTLTKADKDTRFTIKEIKQGDPLKFKAADLWELNTHCIKPDSDFQLGEDLTDEQRVTDDALRFTYYSKTIHASRVLKVLGKRAPSNIRVRLRGWGLSEVEAIVRSINQYLKTTDLSFEVLDEFKIDVYKFKGLATLLQSPKGQEVATKRVSMANMSKDFNTGIALDAEDDYQQKQVSFVGIADVMKEIKMQLAADLRIPMTKLFGQSASGFNSGEDDIENYNAMVESRIRPNIKKTLMHVLRCRCMQLFGFVPTDLKLTLKPLRIMSAEQEETVKTSKFNRVIQARTAGEIDSKEFRECMNKDNLLSIPLDVNKEIAAETDEDDQEEEQADQIKNMREADAKRRLALKTKKKGK